MRRRSSRRKLGYHAQRWRQRERFIKAVLTRLDADVAGGRLTGPGDLHDRLMEAMSNSLPLSLGRHPHRAAGLTKAAMQRALPPSVNLLVEGATHNAAELLAGATSERRGFEKRLHQRWGPAIETLELFRLCCLDAGMAFHEQRKPAHGDWVYGALVRLHARACLVTAEVLALLRAGLASGAHARWRSAHEIAVTAYFIAEHGQDTAERYVLHETIESCRAADGYQRHAAGLGYERLTAEELRELAAAREALVERFGKAYAQAYGWAADALGNPSPKFSDIEEAVSLEHMRPYYRMASYPTHAGPTGLAFNLGLRGQDVMLAGPSNIGLADPGQSVAISLLQATATLLNTEPEMGDLAVMMFLQGACDAVTGAFIRAERALDEDDRDGREPPGSV